MLDYRKNAHSVGWVETWALNGSPVPAQQARA